MKWWKNFSISSREMLKLLSIAGAAGSIGYASALHHAAIDDQRRKYDDSVFQVERDESVAVFPPSLFSRVSAATKVKDSLIIHQANVIPEPSQNAPRISQIMRYGFPSLSNIRSLDDFVLAYDTRLRIPQWVFEHLTPASVAKNDQVDRSKCDFHEDGSVHHYFRSTNEDCKYSGYDRGHMAAAGNHRLSQDICQQTFLLSNMAPQVGKGFNRDKWNELEQHCRKLVSQSRNVYACTGPLFLPRKADDGKLYVKYRVLWDNHVAVPTQFFKVVVCESESGELSMESFLMPNAAIDDAVPLKTFHVPSEVTERASGLLLFDQLNKKQFKLINGKTAAWI
ncbi:endonuclease G, mitochondrial-like [Hyalella azteca]|uniref:Endonuclease n=1 Tax=Hyalella azteca TaxID=294128 RepID=A0A8B7P5D8_HYAAZ|nr:endonuclease G, mitochondrial-like [Hyalella azteca]